MRCHALAFRFDQAQFHLAYSVRQLLLPCTVLIHGQCLLFTAHLLSRYYRTSDCLICSIRWMGNIAISASLFHITCFCLSAASSTRFCISVATTRMLHCFHRNSLPFQLRVASLPSGTHALVATMSCDAQLCFWCLQSKPCMVCSI